jgi:DNA polymerase III subunit gamma/tau
MVFYRKYRPQTISDLDSASLREKLTSVLSPAKQDAIAHAFLFTGPKGLGKTSTARIVAKVINCTSRAVSEGQRAKGKELIEDIEPCNECEMCISITAGTNMDVIEIDAASNRGIDEIRDLKEKVKLSPLSAKKKVYIIDEVHMLTTEAFNALLKTLEEPPEHVVFILCTTEPHKVPATILSRCCHIMFLPATKEELVRSFKRIAAGEGLTIEDAVLMTIAELSDSGFRDGAKILEELVLLSRGREITSELVEEQYKSTSISYQVQEMIRALSLQDTKSAVAIVERLSPQGIDVKYFLMRLLEVLHMELLGVLGVGVVGKSLFTSDELQYLLDIFGKASHDMKTALLPQIPLELAIIEWSLVDRGGKESAVLDVSTTRTVTEVTTQVSSGSSGQAPLRSSSEGQAVTMKTLRKNLGTMAKIKALYGEDSVKQNEVVEEIKTTGVDLLHYDTSSDTKEWMDALWKSIISEMKTYNHTVAGVLRGCYLKSYDKKSVVIEALYKFHKEKLDEAKNMSVLEQICKQLTGNPVSVSVVLRGKE